MMTLLYGLRGNPPGDHVIVIHLCHLRRSLEGSEWGIKNFYGEGWQLVPSAEAAQSPILQAAARRRDHGPRLKARGFAMAAN